MSDPSPIMIVPVETMKAIQQAVGATSHEPADILLRVRELVSNVYRHGVGAIESIPLTSAQIDGLIDGLMRKDSKRK